MPYKELAFFLIISNEPCCTLARKNRATAEAAVVDMHGGSFLFFSVKLEMNSRYSSLVWR